MIDEKIIIIAGVLVALVNIITEVAKNTFPKLKTSKTINLFVLIASIVITIGAYVFYVHFSGSQIDIYGLIASMIGGVLISYSAMFGFDKLLVYFEPWMRGDE